MQITLTIDVSDKAAALLTANANNPNRGGGRLGGPARNQPTTPAAPISTTDAVTAALTNACNSVVTNAERASDNNQNNLIVQAYAVLPDLIRTQIKDIAKQNLPPDVASQIT